MTFKQLLAAIAATAIVSVSCASSALAYPSVYPTGTTFYSPSKAYNSYILVPQDDKLYNSRDAKYRDMRAKKSEKTIESSGTASGAVSNMSTSVKLIDMDGNVMHRWSVTPTPNRRDILLPNGHLLTINSKSSTVEERDWDSNVVWEYKCEYKPHHYVTRLANGNTLILCEGPVPTSRLKDVKNVTVPWWGTIRRKGVKLVGDSIIEVTPDKKIVWRWNAGDDPDMDVNTFSPENVVPDWTHGNTASVIPANHWYDEGDKRFKPGNIIYNPRNHDKFVIIDKDSKKIVYTYEHNYKGGMSHVHEVEMIPEGIPGAGNIMFFDNGLFPRSRDRVGQSLDIEINPESKNFVWKYESCGYSNMKFFAKTKSSQTKLPNGNVLISSDNTGRIFQVVPDMSHPEGGEIVWEYVNVSDVSRARPIPYDYCPQFKNFPTPQELAVTPPDNTDFHLTPAAN